jgi:hypothetical protein
MSSGITWIKIRLLWIVFSWALSTEQGVIVGAVGGTLTLAALAIGLVVVGIGLRDWLASFVINL